MTFSKDNYQDMEFFFGGTFLFPIGLWISGLIGLL
jgi:hypothetical protein